MDLAISRRQALKNTLTLPLFSLLAFLSIWSLQHFLAFLPDQSAYFGEKMRLAFEGAPPRLGHIAFVAPALPYSLTLLFKDPQLASAFLGALLLTYALTLKNFSKIAYTLTLLCPLTLYVLTCRGDLSALILLFLVGIYQVERYLATGKELSLFWWGVCSAAMLLCTYSAAWVILFTYVATLLSKPKLPPFALAFVMLFPLAFLMLVYAVLVTCYHPMLGLTHESLLSYACWQNPYLSLKATLGEVFYALPLILPSIILPFCHKDRSTMVILVPLILVAAIFCRLFFGTYHEETAIFAVPLAMGVFRMPPMKHVAWIFVLPFVYSFFLMASSPNPEEQAFFKTLSGNHQPKATLNVPLEEGEVCLMDDEVHYRTVYQSEDVRRFLLPYHYNFSMALSNPAEYVDYILISKQNPKDRVVQRYPGALHGRFEGFKQIAQDKQSILFKSIN